MPQLLVRKLDDTVVRRLRLRAAAAGISVEEAHRRVLRQALLGPQPPQRDFIAYLRAMPPGDLPPTRSRDLPRKIAL